MQSLTATESEEIIMTKKYSIVANEYENTGGNCMVNITTVYDYERKTMLYVNINEEALVVTTHDFIRNELPGELVIEDITLVDISQSYFTTEPAPDNDAMLSIDDDMTMLLLDCLEAFIKNEVKHSGRNHFTTIDKLPTNLFQQLTDEYKDWLNENNRLVETDGYSIILDELYIASIEAETPNGTVAKELQQHLPNLLPPDVDTDHVLYEEFIHEKIQIIAGGKLFTFDIGADIYNGLCSLVNTVIDEQ